MLASYRFNRVYCDIDELCIVVLIARQITIPERFLKYHVASSITKMRTNSLTKHRTDAVITGREHENFPFSAWSMKGEKDPRMILYHR